MKSSWSALEIEAKFTPEIPVTIYKFVGRDSLVGVAT